MLDHFTYKDMNERFIIISKLSQQQKDGGYIYIHMKVNKMV